MSAPRPAPLTSRPERRKHARKDVIGSQLLSVDINAQEAGALILDISEGGMALQLVAALKSRGKRAFTFKPPGHATRLEVSGVPVWSDGNHLGIRFTDLDDPVHSTISSWINSLPPHHVTPPDVTVKQQSAMSAARLESAELHPTADDATDNGSIAVAPERLDSMAARARLLLSGTGAAVAWGNAEGMVCRATNGNAPPRGVSVDLNRGLSGECVRTGAVVRCDDTESDSRVDPEVCRQLHLRSAIIVPIVSGHQILGLLEVFSDKPRAFSEKDVPTLRTLATQFSPAKEVPSPRPAPVRQPSPARARAVPSKNTAQTAASVPNFQNIATFREKLSNAVERKKPWLNPKIAGVTLAVAAAVIAGSIYLAGYKVSPSRSAAPPVNSAAHPGTAPVVVSSSSRASAQLPRTSSQGKRINASRPPDSIKTVNRDDPSDSPVPAISIQANPEPSSSNADPLPPTIQLTPPYPVGESGLLAAIPSDTSLPKLTTGERVSRVSELKLVHQVAPQYPKVALLERKEGTVVLRLSVGTNGRVKGTQVISGDEEFARAAIDAVRQWRYQPLILDGKPIDASTNAIVTFSLTAKPGR